MASQKSPRAMILDRFAAAAINIDSLAIEETADSIRVTGSVPTETERQRVLAVLGDAQADGVRTTHAVEVRPAGKPRDEAASISALRDPPEPA